MAVQRDKVIASAEKLVAKGKIEPAIKEYERLLEDNPNDVNTLNRIGDLWVRINRNDEAVKVFTKIADHYSKDGFFLKAIAIYKKINKLDPSKLDIYARLADLYAKQGLAMEAKSQYQVLADYYLKHGDPSNALSIYRKISELDPNSINVHVKLADLYSQNNQTGEALKEYDRVGRMLLKRGMLDEAVQVFKKALKIDSKNTELVDSLVTALVEAKDFDNAAQIVDTALETNRDNPRLLATLGKIQLAKGDLNAARATLQRGYAADPNDSAIRENLADVSLRSGDANTALEMIGPLVEKALGRGERGTAVEMLNRILRVESNHTPTLERLVAVYVRLNEETNILASMNSLAEAHIGKMRFEDASKVLEKLIEREPQNAQHRNKLQFVRSQMGGIDTMPAGRQAPAASPVTLEIDEPVPSFDMPEDDGLSLDLDASPAIDLDFSLDMPATPTPAPAAPAMSNLKPAVEIAAEEGNDDLDFITEHLTEAEVFAKYGLAEKAAEHRRAVLERAPKNITAHERLFRILLDEGDVEGARTAANAYLGVLESSGDTGGITAVRNEFLARGKSLEAPKAAPPAPAAPPPMPAVEEIEEELSFDLDEPEPEFDLATDTAVEFEDLSAGTLPAFEPEPEPEIVLDDALLDEPTVEPIVEPVVEPVMEAPAEPVAEPAFEPALAFDSATPSVEETEAFFGVESLADDLQGDFNAPQAEELGELDFYIEQELFDEARNKADALLARFPGNADVAQRLGRIQEAIAAAAARAPEPAPAPAAPPPAASRPPVLSRFEIESELLSAIPDDDDDLAFPASAPPP
ncbi:MAG TPA: tetratricopeptide repeat protein, partial [Thermoanaerobaculia bacterium]